MIVMRIIVALVAVAASTQVSWAQSSVQTCQLGSFNIGASPTSRAFGLTNLIRLSSALQSV